MRRANGDLILSGVRSVAGGPPSLMNDFMDFGFCCFSILKLEVLAGCGISAAEDDRIPERC